MPLLIPGNCNPSAWQHWLQLDLLFNDFFAFFPVQEPLRFGFLSFTSLWNSSRISSSLEEEGFGKGLDLLDFF
ncbi:unnamed protein product [Trifolium pratense]|uniref:Uncharacterized protein n=1 Tax=Trifolium pratense TaxID=57577 RepID=A0ACB0KLL6_TRIPR|nr:unnamed protein product [Trifolium pratense]